MNKPVPSATTQTWVREQSERETSAWVAGLSKSERRQMQERARKLDQLPAHGSDNLRIAFVGTPEGSEDKGRLLDLAYLLGQAGHLIWVVSHERRPDREPVDYADIVQWVNADAAGPLTESLPPVELFVVTSGTVCAELYRADRPCVYLQLSDAAGLEPHHQWMPSRWLSLVPAKNDQLGRTVFFLPQDSTGLGSMMSGAAAAVTNDPLRKKRPRISLCMIARNEATRVERCILSTFGVVDEVCLVDTGSTDATVSLAKRAAARVEHHPWQDDFALHRNQSLAMATGDWVLHLDADEELTPELRKAIPQLAQRSGVSAFMIPVDSVMPEGTSRVYITRLFRRAPGAAFHGRIHENIGKWLTSMGASVEVVHAPILHHGYNEDPMRATGKRSRNRNLLVKALEEEPENPWYRYYLAAEDYLVGEPAAALDLLKNTVDHYWVEGQPALLEYSCHYTMGAWAKALEALRAGCKRYPRALSLWAQQARLAYALGDLDLCRTSIGELRTNRNLVGSPELAQVTADYFEGCMAANRQDAVAYWSRCVRQTATMRTLFRSLMRSHGLETALVEFKKLPLTSGGQLGSIFQALVDLQEWGAAARLLERYPQDKPFAGVGDLFWSQGETDEAIRIWQQAGEPGWVRYGIVAALFGDEQDLKPSLDRVTPLQARSLQDIQRREVSWRPAVVVPELMDMGSPDLVAAMVERYPFLGEAITGYHRLYVEP